MVQTIGAVPRWARDRLRPVRQRLTVVATLLLAVALALAAGIMLLVLRAALNNSADTTTQGRADHVASVLATEGSGGVDSVLLAATKDVDVIQVIDAHGTIVASTPGAARGALSSPQPTGSRRTIDDAQIDGKGEEYRSTTVGVATRDGDLTVVAGAAEGPMHRILLTVAIIFCVVFPIVLLLLAATTYYSVGRALRPVDRIRAQVDDISGGDLHRRVPVPDTDDEIAELATTMNRMLRRIESAREQQLRFVGDASHELRSPLVTLVGLLDLASSTDTPVDRDTVDTLMLPEALRLQSMVADLLLLARADERGLPLDLGDVDLDDVVGAEAARVDALRHHRVDVDVAPARVRGDLDKLTRAIRNITDNADRHARRRIGFRVRTDRAFATVTITDDGVGISPADCERVFERFVRLDSHRDREGGGSGLGLAIVDEIVRAHGGAVRIDDIAGGGAAVTITVPMAGPGRPVQTSGSPPSSASR
ncbi:sensor histidine kinase [Williamsia sterculiae]|uniref:histidine kinase n=1 Tax=Williamsia sterculiae TaxID=1344003 RepID=A0A1N7GA54_9NOCA|nr:HAMP domain-containing sensor histidine kinase [Williamsia sterculiae]SIS09417.1 Signal transduction histidine kinase [Williamsia sterculiae]